VSCGDERHAAAVVGAGRQIEEERERHRAWEGRRSDARVRSESSMRGSCLVGGGRRQMRVRARHP